MHRRRAGRGGAVRGRPLTEVPKFPPSRPHLAGDERGPAHPGTRLHELRLLVRLSLPIALAQFGLIAMSLVDTAVLGRVSVDDLAGAGMGRAIGYTAMITAVGVTGALEPVAAQALGAGEPARAWRGYVTNLQATLLLWAPLIAVAFLVTAGLPPLGVAPPVVTRVRMYLGGQAPGLAAMLAYFASKTFLQAHGRTAPALWGSIAANAVNFVVSNLLVRGDDALAAVGLAPRGLPRLGALGGGIAFSIGGAVLLAFVLVPALRYRTPSPAEPGALRAMYRLGTPIGLQLLAEMGIFSLVALLSGALGSDVAAAHQVAIGLASFTFMGALGVAGATAVRVGYAVGAGASPRRAGTLGIGLGAAFMVAGAIAFAAFPRWLVAAFTNDERVIEIGVRLVRIAALFQLFDGVQCVAAGALRGAGDVRFSFVTNVIAHWFVGFPIALTLGFALHGGAPGLWWGLTAGLVLVAVTLAWRFRAITSRSIARIGLGAPSS